jgi:hypothetical protein
VSGDMRGRSLLRGGEGLTVRERRILHMVVAAVRRPPRRTRLTAAIVSAKSIRRLARVANVALQTISFSACSSAGRCRVGSGRRRARGLVDRAPGTSARVCRAGVPPLPQLGRACPALHPVALVDPRSRRVEEGWQGACGRVPSWTADGVWQSDGPSSSQEGTGCACVPSPA